MFCMFFVFFKQKTAYEMRISDWSSDVCSSDLDHLALLPDKAVLVFDYRFDGSLLEQPFSDDVVLDFMRHRDDRGFDVDATLFPQSRKLQIGRSDERSVGKACVRTCSYRWSPYH